MTRSKLMDTRRFDYTATADGHKEQAFTSDVEYQPGDELPLGNGRWKVTDVEDIAWNRWDENRDETIRSRRLRCTVTRAEL